MLKNLITLDFLKGFRTIAAAAAAFATGVVSVIDGDVVAGIQAMALGLGMLGIRFQ